MTENESRGGALLGFTWCALEPREVTLYGVTLEHVCATRAGQQHVPPQCVVDQQLWSGHVRGNAGVCRCGGVDVECCNLFVGSGVAEDQRYSLVAEQPSSPNGCRAAEQP
eukprot:355828-Chlamydomonas_euryale.AAC.2